MADSVIPELSPALKVAGDSETAPRKARILERQRQRRARNRRIDYYPDPEAARVIDAQVRNVAGGDYSSVINRIVRQWQATSGIRG